MFASCIHCHCRSKSQIVRLIRVRLQKSRQLISPSPSFKLTGMHRKSIEAADKLRCSDDEGDTDLSKDGADSMMSNEGTKRRTPPPIMTKLPPPSMTESSEDMDSLALSKSSSPSSALALHERDPPAKDDLRSHSIAALRAKAMEHSAKLLSQSSAPVSHHVTQITSPPVIPTSMTTYSALERQTNMSYPFHATSRPIY